MSRSIKAILTSFGGMVALAGCTPALTQQVPITAAMPVRDADAARIEALLARMSLEHKVAQLIQPQINSITPEDMRRYRFGSYLNGGNGGPYGNEFAPAGDWLRLADEMWAASTAPLPNGEPAIPALWGTDAVHGHTNVVGATIFPHNIGLGAANDPDLVRRIGAATAAEIAATGIDWNFSPTVAVAQDDRWGRTYESYSEDPDTVARLGAALVEGLQGTSAPGDRIAPGHVIATAKHFFGDGGTLQGVDQGDVEGDPAALEALHARPYPAAIAAGVEAIMASFNSVNGTKMHGNAPLLTGLLRGRMGFTGVVVGDWNGHAQIPGCTNDNCPQALLAGLDIYMVPDDAKTLHANLLAQVKDGTIPMARLDEAVRRVLMMKLRAGVLDPAARRPSERVARGAAVLGTPAHRALAREAVAKSQVLLKNDGILPLKPGARLLVAGKAADDIAQAAGGWTLTWQGGEGLTNASFPGATSIFAGIRQEATANGGSAELSPDGSWRTRPDAAIVVFGEQPYAEFVGDRRDLVFADTEGLDLLRRFEKQGIPTVAVFLSGRPLWLNRELNAADAFVASWLPGGEGAGVADVLFGKQPFGGRLSFSWPAGCTGTPVNGPEGALFQRGYGLSLGEQRPFARLDESCAFLDTRSTVWFDLGRLGEGVRAEAGGSALPGLRGNAGGIVARGYDRARQEDARELVFAPGAALTFAHGGGAESGGYRVLYELPQAPAGPVTLTLGGRVIDVTAALRASAGKGWRQMVITAACAPADARSLTITSAAPLTLRLARIARQEMPAGVECSF